MRNRYEPISKIWDIARAYMIAKESVIVCGYAYEIDWQNELSFDSCTERSFLRESAWVILSSGMRESVIRNKFPFISDAFCGWKSAKHIVKRNRKCRNEALHHFNSIPKIDAIIKVATHVHDKGFEFVYNSVKRDGVNYISQFPYMGPATSYHLAKNIGLSVAKPDRHLKRIASAVGYNSAQLLCLDIADLVGDKISVVDLVLWRYATLFENYLSIFPTPESEIFDKDDCGLCWLHARPRTSLF